VRHSTVSNIGACAPVSVSEGNMAFTQTRIAKVRWIQTGFKPAADPAPTTAPEN
jgi:hypothetical protein